MKVQILFNEVTATQTPDSFRNGRRLCRCDWRNCAMPGLLFSLVLTITLLAPFAMRRNQPPIVVDDQRACCLTRSRWLTFPCWPTTWTRMVIRFAWLRCRRSRVAKPRLSMARRYECTLIGLGSVAASSSIVWRMAPTWSATAQRCGGRVGLSGAGRSCTHRLRLG